jgi:capping protein (actin filament) muscle Z-line, beta
MNLSGNMTRQVEADVVVENDASHVANIGRLVEDMELKMRNLLREDCLPFGRPWPVLS